MKINPEHINIRTKYQSGDIGKITKMHGELYKFGVYFESYVAETLADFYRNMDAEKECVWLAEYKEEVIGSIALKNTDDWAQLRYFLINPEFRGIGLGKRMINLFMDFMTNTGYSKSFLLTESQLKIAAHLYGQFGYQYVSKRETDYGLEEIRYEKYLSI